MTNFLLSNKNFDGTLMNRESLLFLVSADQEISSYFLRNKLKKIESLSQGKKNLIVIFLMSLKKK